MRKPVANDEAGQHLDQELGPEAVGRPFEQVDHDRNAAKEGVAAEAEQRPADLLALVARRRQPQAAQQHQHGDDHEADEDGLIELAFEEHQDRKEGEQDDQAPRQIAVREQQDSGEQADVAEVVERDVDARGERRRWRGR